MHVIVRDNAGVVTEALYDTGVESVGCLADALQMSVNDGLRSQPALNDAVALCRKIANNFRYSTLAGDDRPAPEIRLTDSDRIPQDGSHRILQDGPHWIPQDVRTGWNWTFCTIRRLVERKKAVMACLLERGLVATLSDHQWQLLEKLMTVLQPLEETMCQMSSGDATLSDVIPVVTALRLVLERQDVSDPDVQTTKCSLLTDVRKGFTVICERPVFVVATAVDPRYRLRFFDDALRRRAAELVAAELRATPAEHQDSRSTSPPATKRPCTTEPAAAAGTLSGVMREIVSRGVPTLGSANVSNDPVEDEVQLFLAQPNIGLCESATSWWRENAHLYPRLAVVARRFLSAPATSVPVQQLFSADGILQHDRPLSDGEDLLLFIKHNIKFE